MENKAARILSYVLHPLLIPSFFLLVLYHLTGFDYSLLTVRYRWAFWLLIFIMTFVFPALVMLALKRYRIIESLSMDEKNERMIPLLIVSLIYFATFYTIQKFCVHGFRIFTFFMLGTTMLILLTMAMNYFTKISLHMTAWGGFTGVLTAISLLFQVRLFFWLFLIIFLSGIVAYARLTLKAHKPFQVYLGYLSGFVFMLLLFLLV
jgi:hypothetical protein